MKNVFHILNPSSHSAAWARSTAEKARDMAPWAWVARDHPQHTETLLDWALKENMQRLVVWGGDGTFHRVVRGLWQRKALDKMELALVPAGTCNDLARRLGLTRDLWKRWQTPHPEGRLASLVVARIRWSNPAGENGEDIFINNAGFGRPRSSFEAKHGSIGVLRAFQPLRVSARWPAGKLQGLYYMALACRSPYFSGGLYFEKDLSPEEKTLRFYFVPATSKVRLALRLLRGRLGLSLLDDKTTRLTATHMALESETPVWPQADGEPPPVEGVRRMEFDLLPEKVRLWVPS